LAGSRRAVFLDRDDTLCKDVPYCRRPEDLHLLPGAGEAVSRLNKAGFAVVVITNQSGIARGWLTEEILVSIHEKMKKDLADLGAKVDGIYHCPHMPDEGCGCRKPKPAMVVRAVSEMDLDPKRSFTIGDRLFDVQLGRNSGTKAILVRAHTPSEELAEAERLADHVSPDLSAAVDWILSFERK
jgi:histidinol-phosphate phosphatase family protein